MRRRTKDPVGALLGRGAVPLASGVEVDFGTDEGPLGELRAVYTRCNGFFVFNAGVHLFRAGEVGEGYDLGYWNAPGTWKDSYSGYADGPLWFAQDVFGRQFGVASDAVVALNPETAEVEVVAESLAGWAQWLLDDPIGNACYEIATQWQDAFGALGATDRLVHRQLLVLGGDNDVANVVVADAVAAMRVRGPVAAQVVGLPDGATVQIDVT